MDIAFNQYKNDFYFKTGMSDVFIDLLYLNTIYLTSITQTAQRTYRCILESADVGVLWSYIVEETGELRENHPPWTGDHYPATCRHRDSIPGRSGGKRVL